MSLINEIKNIKSTRKELKNFGIVMAIAFGLVGIIMFFKGNFLYLHSLVLSGAFLVLGFFIPKTLLPLQKIWMGIAVVIGFFVSRIILTLLFFLVITPMGLFLKLIGKDILKIKFNHKLNSYWITKETKEFNKEQYEKQF